ncbi:hypothetical protein PVK06_030732 [Gossypium arboreum]|uniref:Uncharacterized protein n=1 Tax=Gossypium arboreum TaxID=29729 RepID=A0ABR0NRM3_GOSAR|nr:hypothetical protein PVK06_030732 [Gossypium arboreum]
MNSKNPRRNVGVSIYAVTSLLQLITGPHYFVLILLPLVLTFSVNSKPSRHMSMEYAVISVSKIDILSGLRTYCTCVWVACGAHSLFCALLGCMRAEVMAFPRFLRAQS